MSHTSFSLRSQWPTLPRSAVPSPRPTPLPGRLITRRLIKKGPLRRIIWEKFAATHGPRGKERPARIAVNFPPRAQSCPRQSLGSIQMETVRPHPRSLARPSLEAAGGTPQPRPAWRYKQEQCVQLNVGGPGGVVPGEGRATR